MKITLQRKFDPTDKDPLIVQYLEGEEGRQTKKTIQVKIGETLELDDDLCIEIMQKYRGLFAIGDTVKPGARTEAYAHKGKPGFQAKVPTAVEG